MDEKLVSRLLLIGLAVVVLAILVAQYNQKGKNAGGSGSGGGSWSKETFVQPSYGQVNDLTVAPTSVAASVPAVVQPSETSNNESYKAVNFDVQQKLPSECVPRDKLTVDDLLPKDAANSKWAQVAPAGQGDVTDQNFLTAGYLVGVNTVGQSLRNANQQLRSDPPIERMNVGPWNQTTIEYDNSRKFFEIGNC
jgi:hypothetical protein